MIVNKKGFASDNNSGVHAEVMQAILAANTGHVVAYGDDPYTGQALSVLQQHFGSDSRAFFTFNGTGANVLSFKAFTHSYHSIICAETSHINVDECGAPEKFTGCKLLAVPSADGKITVEGIERHLHGLGFEHHSQPGIVSLTQATEVGTVYTQAELIRLTGFAHRQGLLVHMDGARLCNAAASLQCSLSSLTREAGIDVLSFGITKNGALMGEVVIFLNTAPPADFKYYRKQAMQLGSKMRFLSVQFIAMLEGDLWRRNALQANRMAQLLAEKVRDIPEIRITQKVQANGVFAIVPGELIAPLQQEYFFYVWDEKKSEVRWMTSFDTTEDDISGFVATIRKLLKKN